MGPPVHPHLIAVERFARGGPVRGEMHPYLARAIAHAAHASGSGGPPIGLLTWTPTGVPQRTGSGLTVVHLQQRHAGIPVLGSGRSVRFDATGTLVKFTGETSAVDPTLPLTPTLSVRDGVYAACRFVANEVLPDPTMTSTRRVSNRRPRLVGQFPGPESASILRKPPFEGPILASLVVVAEEPALAWDVRLQLPGPLGAYSVLVAAAETAPRVIAMRRRSSHAVSAVVYRLDPRSVRVSDPLPRRRADYPRFGDRAIQRTAWCSGSDLSGNNVVCIDDHGNGFTAQSVGADLRFEAADALGIDQAKINAFYTCNYLHDFFLLLGFDEALGNFQKENRPGAGVGGDPLRVVIWDAPIPGAAFFKPEPDGAMAELHLGRIGTRHTALDSGVVIHEFTHGVTTRVIGGPAAEAPLTKPQSRALGEGYSDYFALTILNRERRRSGLPATHVYGAWVSANDATGLRPFAYDASFAGTYGLLGAPPFQTDHDAGQVWCAALLDVHGVLVGALGLDDGEERAWQLAFDSLRLLHPGAKGPTFLHARDGLLAEFDAAVTAGRVPADPALRRQVEDAFTRRGMGPAARSENAGYRGIHEDLGPFGGDE